MGLWNATYLGPSAKLLYFENQIATFVGIGEKLLLFETQIATFVRISKKLPLFYSKCCIPWEIHKFATFSINYVKLNFFNQLLLSCLIVANILVSLLFKFVDNISLFRYINTAVLRFFITSRCAHSFVKIYDLWPLSMNLQKLNAFLLYKTYIFEVKPNFFFTVTKKWPYSLPFFQKWFYIKFSQ